MSTLSRRDFLIKAHTAFLAAAIPPEALHAAKLHEIESALNLTRGQEDDAISGRRPSSTRQSIVLRSLGGNLAVILGINPEGHLFYSIEEGGMEVLPASPLGLTVDGVDLGQGVKIAGRQIIREIDETYPIFGNHAEARNRAKEAIIPLETAEKRFSLVARAYDDGVAVRYLLPDNAKHIGADSTGWRLPQDTEKVVWSEYAQSYEGLSHATSLGDVPQGHPVMAPIAIKLSHHYLSISEADCENFSDMSVTCHGNLLQATFAVEPDGWDVSSSIIDRRPGVLQGTYMGKAASPWRTTVVAHTLTALIDSDLLTNLCPAPANNMDFTWVKPGRSLWSWWSVYHPPYEDLKSWYDAAAELTWEYYLIDSGWAKWSSPGKDHWAMLKDISDYGKSVGVKTIVWGAYSEIPTLEARRTWLENAKAAGVEGVKLDFPPAGKASVMNSWYMGSLHDCAELRLLVDFHGAVKPSGLRRTYPNGITREGVRGNEYHMSRYKRIAPLFQDVTLPFARPLAGPADITPVMMNPQELSTSGFTWPHELAQAIVILSPVTAFADQYKYYLDPALKDLFQRIPTVWDETRVLPCTEIGEIVAYARRKGNNWWVGVMNGGTQHDIHISFNFLEKPGRGTLVYDDPSHDAAVDRREREIRPHDVLPVTLRPAGGFVARIALPASHGTA